MKQVQLKQVKQGEFFKLRETENAPVWVRGEYDREDKKYLCAKFDNINYEQMFKGNRIVFIGFDF